MDADRGQYGRFLMTGSPQFTLMKGVTESSAGEAANLEYVRRSLPGVKTVSGAIVCRAPNRFPVAEGVHAVPVGEIGSAGR